MARKTRSKADRQLDALYEAKNLAEESTPRLMRKAIARFEKRLDEPCKVCHGQGKLTAEIPPGPDAPPDVVADVVERECPQCQGDGKGAGLGKEEIMFLRFLQGASLHKDRLIEDLGLNPRQLSGGSGKHPLLTIIGDVNVKSLSTEEMETLLIEMAGGGKKKPAPVIDVKPVEPSDAPG